MRNARLLVIAIGILLPYLARVPGIFVKGTGWLTSYLEGGLGALVFIAGLQAICWGSILAASLSYRHPASLWFPAVLGFGFVALAHGFLDLSSTSTAAVALVAIPFASLPLVFVGWLLGLWYDR